MAKSKDDSLRLYGEENAARAAAYALLHDTFEFYDEVEAISAEGDNFRIDAVCRCGVSGYVFGWEFKRSHLFKKEFAAAIRQAIHYRLARITDERLPELSGTQLSDCLSLAARSSLPLPYFPTGSANMTRLISTTGRKPME